MVGNITYFDDLYNHHELDDFTQFQPFGIKCLCLGHFGTVVRAWYNRGTTKLIRGKTKHMRGTTVVCHPQKLL